MKGLSTGLKSKTVTLYYYKNKNMSKLQCHIIQLQIRTKLEVLFLVYIRNIKENISCIQYLTSWIILLKEKITDISFLLSINHVVKTSSCYQIKIQMYTEKDYTSSS